MHNNRRRKFSVKLNLNLKDTSTIKNDSHSSTDEKPISTRFFKSEPELGSSLKDANDKATQAENEVTIKPGTIDFHTKVTEAEDVKVGTKVDTKNRIELIERNDSRSRSLKRHRAKVRSLKRRACETDDLKINSVETTGTDTIDWNREAVCLSTNFITLNPALVNANFVGSNFDDGRESIRSFGDMCRICHGSEASCSDMGLLISACSCRGTVGRIHVKCLERWLTESGKSRCELCGTRYTTRRVHKYGFPKALIVWILSHNAKQLLIDCLGIMLMSPLAVMAAWLSGRTLAGLLAQDSNLATWPLASTFVLACMTLVCYYCWIVSAVTRHALGWWVWYQSQYEVRLQFQDPED